MDRFSALPDDSRLWLFAFEHRIGHEQHAALSADIDDYLTRWKAHGHSVKGAFSILDDHFLIVAADPSITEVSGCSIDALFRNSKAALAAAGIALADASTIFYRLSGEVHTATREHFRSLVEGGVIHGDTSVFDTTIQSLQSLRSGQFELPYAASWHQRLFGQGARIVDAA